MCLQAHFLLEAGELVFDGNVGAGVGVLGLKRGGLVDGLTVELQPQCLQCGTRIIHPEPGAAAWIQTETGVSWRYIVLDMLSDPAFSYYHHMKTFSDLHSAYVYIRIRNGIHKILN